MAYTLVPTELIVDGAITSAKLDTNIAISGTLGVTGEVTLATHLIMGDNDKIKIGTGGDLEIYHDGSNSYISNSTGNIYLGDTNGAVHIQAKLNEESIICAADGAVTLYHDNSPKLATTSTGIDVTGTATMDGLTVDSTLATINSSGPNVDLVLTENSTNTDARIRNSNGILEIDADLNNEFGNSSMMFAVDGVDKLKINNNGDISFYEDTGTTAKFFWDASAESLGIGTTSPQNILHTDSANTGEVVGLALSNSNTSFSANEAVSIKFGVGSATALAHGKILVANTDSGFGSNGYMSFYTRGSDSVTERMRIDSLGNVRVGVGNTFEPTIQFTNSGRVASNPAYSFNGDLDTGMFNPSTQGTIAFSNNGTESMRINSSGTVLFKSGSFPTNQDSPFIYRIGGGSLAIGAATETGTSAHAAFYTNSLERMRIDSSGNVGIGTTSPTSYPIASDLVIDTGTNGGITIKSGTSNYGGVFFADGTTGDQQYRGFVQYNHNYAGSTDELLLGTAGAERMRIDASGNLMVGTTSTSAKVHIKNSGASFGFLAENSNSSYGAAVIAHTATSGTRYLVDFRAGSINPSDQVGTITSNGTSTSYNTSSDYRLKENVNYEFNALDRVAQLKPARFNFIANADITVDGFLAHEVQDIVPEAISGEKDGEEMQGIDQSKLVPLLTKAIQEQQTIIDDLKSRIETLEG